MPTTEQTDPVVGRIREEIERVGLERRTLPRPGDNLDEEHARVDGQHDPQDTPISGGPGLIGRGRFMAMGATGTHEELSLPLTRGPVSAVVPLLTDRWGSGVGTAHQPVTLRSSSRDCIENLACDGPSRSRRPRCVDPIEPQRMTRFCGLESMLCADDTAKRKRDRDRSSPLSRSGDQDRVPTLPVRPKAAISCVLHRCEFFSRCRSRVADVASHSAGYCCHSLADSCSHELRIQLSAASCRSRGSAVLVDLEASLISTPNGNGVSLSAFASVRRSELRVTRPARPLMPWPGPNSARCHPVANP